MARPDITVDDVEGDIGRISLDDGDMSTVALDDGAVHDKQTHDDGSHGVPDVHDGHEIHAHDAHGTHGTHDDYATSNGDIGLSLTADTDEIDLGSPVADTNQAETASASPTPTPTPQHPPEPSRSSRTPSPVSTPTPASASAQGQAQTPPSASASPRSSVSSRRHQTPSPIAIRPMSSDSRRSHSFSKHSQSGQSAGRRSGAFSPTFSASSPPPHSNGSGYGSGSEHGGSSVAASSSSPRLVTSSRFRSVEVPLPSLTASVSAASSHGPELPAVVDEGAPFESVPLDTDAPPPPPLPAQVTPSGKRDSWKRESITKTVGGLGGLVLGHHSISGPPSAAGSSSGTAAADSKHGTTQSLSVNLPSSGNGNGSGSRSAPISGASTPLRHAPPAHPHPFPIPSAPNSPHVGSGSLGSMPAPVAPVPHPHQGIGVKGVSTLDKFISRTRPQHLPPKSRDEDLEHLHAWEHMMAKSREHEAERRRHAEQKRLEKERHILAITPRWEALLNDPEFSVAKVRSNPSNRQLWFEGVPPRLRGQAWAQAIGNPLAMNKDAYKAYLRRAHKAYAAGRFPQSIIDQMEADMDNTFPTLHVFHRGSPMRDDLKDLISAWVVWRSDQARGYAPHISQVAAMFLLTSAPGTAFLSLVNFLARPTLSAFYNNVKDEIDAFYRVFENLQADMFPRIFANCQNLGLRLPESYFRSVLVEQVPFAVACRLWDQIMLDGDAYIFRAALAIFGFLEPRLYYPDKEEILSVLEGRNRATQAITERERERARLRGETYEDALDGKLSVFGLHEEPLFEWLANDGWRDSRFDRLVTRELPD